MASSAYRQPSSREHSIIQRRSLLTGVGLLASGPLMAGSAAILPASVSESIARHLCAPLTRAVAAVAALLPVSVSEILLVSLAAGIVVAATRRLRHQEVSLWRRALLIGFDLMRLTSLLIASFYLLWGFGYSAPPLAERMDLASPETAVTEEALLAFARLAVDRTNEAYLEYTGQADGGQPTTAPASRAWTEELRESLDHWSVEVPRLALAPQVRTPLKTLASSELFHRMGISGVYSPFFGEAHVVGSLPGCIVGQVTAHEMAHQRGIHREDEANFAGYLACTSAPSPFLRYSGWLFAQRQALRALARLADPAVTDLVQARLPGVQRDVDDLHAYWEVARGRTGRVATRMNHAYLRSQRVQGGVASYGRSLDLILRWQGDPRNHL